MALYFASMGAGRMAWPVAAACRASRSRSAAAGCWRDVAGFGLDGQFLAVALGITAYGVVTALGVRRRVWCSREGVGERIRLSQTRHSAGMVRAVKPVQASSQSNSTLKSRSPCDEDPISRTA